jgi:hypothetical protein
MSELRVASHLSHSIAGEGGPIVSELVHGHAKGVHHSGPASSWERPRSAGSLRSLVPRLGHAQAIGAITHRLCRLIWKILHQSVRYEERGPAVSVEAKKVRARKMIRELRTLGYRIELISPGPVA